MNNNNSKISLNDIYQELLKNDPFELISKIEMNTYSTYEEFDMICSLLNKKLTSKFLNEFILVKDNLVFFRKGIESSNEQLKLLSLSQIEKISKLENKDKVGQFLVNGSDIIVYLIQQLELKQLKIVNKIMNILVNFGIELIKNDLLREEIKQYIKKTEKDIKFRYLEIITRIIKEDNSKEIFEFLTEKNMFNEFLKCNVFKEKKYDVLELLNYFQLFEDFVNNGYEVISLFLSEESNNNNNDENVASIDNECNLLVNMSTVIIDCLKDNVDDIMIKYSLSPVLFKILQICFKPTNNSIKRTENEIQLIFQHLPVIDILSLVFLDDEFEDENILESSLCLIGSIGSSEYGITHLYNDNENILDSFFQYLSSSSDLLSISTVYNLANIIENNSENEIIEEIFISKTSGIDFIMENLRDISNDSKRNQNFRLLDIISSLSWGRREVLFYPRSLDFLLNRKTEIFESHGLKWKYSIIKNLSSNYEECSYYIDQDQYIKMKEYLENGIFYSPMELKTQLAEEAM